MQQEFTGQFGFVLLLDEATKRKASELASEYSQGNSIDLNGKHEPHITLYHGKFVGVTAQFVTEHVEQLAQRLPMQLSFFAKESFGGKFLFWDTNRTKELVEAHNRTLDLSMFLERSGEQQADKEKLTLSAEQKTNVHLFGHPLVQNLWRPHITLGYFPAGILFRRKIEPFSGVATGIAFVRVGEVGTIAQVIQKRIL